jgi:uncharacterized membrane protein YgdD (TMEM256/DUF423 family)
VEATRGTALALAGLLGALGVMAGAFGAHGLEGRVPAERLAAWRTGALYHLVHAVALLALACGPQAVLQHAAGRTALTAWGVGVLVFSGSLYLLTVTGYRLLGAVTPVGGVALIAGWVAVVWAGLALRGG